VAKTIDIESYLERRRAGHERDEPSAECDVIIEDTRYKSAFALMCGRAVIVQGVHEEDEGNRERALMCYKVALNKGEEVANFYIGRLEFLRSLDALV